MTDVELLNQWMDSHNLTLPSLARDMGLDYVALYMMTKKRNKITDKFIVQFIRRYGCEEAVAVFASRLKPSPS